MTPSYLREVIADNTAASVKRYAMVVASTSLGIATVLLAVAACAGQNVDLALGAVTVPLAGLAGYSYVQGKAVEAANAKQIPD